MDGSLPAQRIHDELGAELWRELVGDLAGQLDARIQEIKDAEGDLEALESAAHSLKGAALGLDLSRLADASHRLEVLAREGGEVSAAIAALAMVTARTRRELDAALARG